MTYIPYTYLIGWSKHNKWYYGVEYGAKKDPPANPQNLWTTYFTSSNVVAELRERLGEPDIIQVRQVFDTGTTEQRMSRAIKWEKKVLGRVGITESQWINGRIGGDICPENNRKIAQLRYGVDNVFQAPEVQQKIRQTNLRRWGAAHPSHSKELLQRKKENNLRKYGVTTTTKLPGVKEKMLSATWSKETRQKRTATNLRKYGAVTPSSDPYVKEKILETRQQLSNRHEVLLIREYLRVFREKLGSGWYQKPDEQICRYLSDLQTRYGYYTLDSLRKMNSQKKYQEAIRKLQDRSLVKQIQQYRKKYGKQVRLGRSWDRKSEQHLRSLLATLQEKYGIIS